MTLPLYLRIRRLLTDGFDLLEQIHNTLNNHVLHKLEDHDQRLAQQDEKLDSIEGKLDKIADKL